MINFKLNSEMIYKEGNKVVKKTFKHNNFGKTNILVITIIK